jgi:NAD+ synthase
MNSNQISSARAEISEKLKVVSLYGQEDLNIEIEKRIEFIKERVRSSGVKSLVLGISGGVDSLTAGKLCQKAVEELRSQEGLDVRFIAVRLPFNVQADETDAQASLEFINPDEIRTVNIGDAVNGLMAGLLGYEGEEAGKVDFVKGNVKARTRMIAQYAIANFTGGMVVGTDHASEAVMGFFTKGGDGFSDLAPLSGLVKAQVRSIAAALDAPGFLVNKTPTADLEELDPGKPDEVAYGCTYEQIDNFLLGHPVDDEVAERIISVYRKTQHKRELPYTPE